MPVKRRKRSSPARRARSVTFDQFRELQADLAKCELDIENLVKEVELHIKRMGAMQAELDHLRGKIRE